MVYEAVDELISQFSLDAKHALLHGQHNPWLKIYRESAAAPIRLYCFSHVGGAASVYKHWPEFLSSKVEVCAVQLPGREERQHENLCEDIEDVVNKLVTIIAADPRPTIFFGHSFGSILAFALASRLQTLDIVPNALIVSAKTAPHLPSRKLRSNLPRVQLIQELVAMGGTPDSVLNDRVMIDRALRIVRADYSVLESFKPNHYLDSLACPIIAFEASDDTYTSSGGIDAWSEYTQARFTKHCVTGGHFYINDHPERLFSVINAMVEDLNLTCHNQ